MQEEKKKSGILLFSLFWLRLIRTLYNISKEDSAVIPKKLDYFSMLFLVYLFNGVQSSYVYMCVSRRHMFNMQVAAYGYLIKVKYVVKKRLHRMLATEVIV